MSEGPSIGGHNMLTQKNQALMIKDFGLFIFYRDFAGLGKGARRSSMARAVRLTRKTGEGDRA